MVTLRQSQLTNNILRCLVFALVAVTTAMSRSGRKCEGSNQQLKYLWGDALSDPTDCVGPNGTPYPSATIAKTFRSNSIWSGSSRSGRAMNTMDPHLTSKTLLHNYKMANDASEGATMTRNARSNLSGYGSRESCLGTPARLCKTRYNTTAPMYGVSLTSGQPVTIVQKFPDLLQQVVFEICESAECDVVRGECTQTYVPYLFLVIPLGPVTLTGQDYVLVESGCVCKPKYAASSQETSSKSIIPHL